MAAIHIIAVEDNEADAALLKRAFGKLETPLDVEVLRDFQVAMQRFGAMREAPRLVLLDLNLGGQSGLSLLRLLRSRPTVAAVPVVILSSSSAPHDVAAAYRDGANAYLVKPLDMSEFMRTVDALAHVFCRGPGAQVTVRSGKEGGAVPSGAGEALRERYASLAARAGGGAEVLEALELARQALDKLDQESVLADQALHAHMKAERHLEAIIENIPAMIFLKDAEELRFARFNKAGEELLGHPREDLLGKNDYDFFPAAEADFFIKKDREVLAEKKLLDIPEEPIETRLKGRRYLHTKKIPLLDAKGDPEFLLGISVDVTEQKHARDVIVRSNEDLEREISARTEELIRSNADLQRFAYVASHDLKEPLRGVHAFASILRDECGDELSDQGQECLRFITQGVGRMGQLIEALLAYSRVASSDAKKESLSLSVPLDDARRSLRTLIEETQSALKVRGELPMLWGNRELLALLFQNLISNAIKFRSKSAPPVVDIEVSHDDDMCRIACTDNGIGVAPEKAEQVFEMFARLHRQEEYPGSGIGLAVCRRVVEHHGGTIRLSSDGKSGTTLAVTLPRGRP